MKMYHRLLMWLYDKHNKTFHEWAQYIDDATKEALEEE
tara:strand:+ start:378 stop:491 length:114 start_codon:yes stop_codon:yes gene_type:complete